MQMRDGSAGHEGRVDEIILVGQQVAPRFARGFVFSGVSRACSGERTGSCKVVGEEKIRHLSSRGDKGLSR
jgi:hypothetical protein